MTFHLYSAGCIMKPGIYQFFVKGVKYFIMQYLFILLILLIPLSAYSKNNINQNKLTDIKTDSSGERENISNNINNQNTGTARSGWRLDSAFGARYNYDGMYLTSNVYYSFPLSNDPGMLWKSTGINIGLQEYITPAFQRASVYFKITPIAFFDIAAYAGYDYMYKSLTGGMKTLSSPDSEYDADSLDKIEGRAKGGLRMSVIPTLKFAFHNIAALYSLKIEYHDYNSDEYYYDYETSLIHKGRDTGFEHDATLAYLLRPFNNSDILAIVVILTDYHVNSTGDNSMTLMGALEYNFAWPGFPETVESNLALAGGTYLHDRYEQGNPTLAVKFGVYFKLN